MAEVRLTAEPRDELGKGPARRVRAAGRVPAVLYGHGQEPRHLSLPGHELMLALKGGANTLLSISIGGAQELALPKVVVRDPIKGFFEHIDLLAVRRGEKVTVSVPINVVGEAADDTLVDVQLSTLSVEAEATHIPTGFEVDVSGLQHGDSISAAQVRLPEGVTLAAEPDAVVVQILAATSAEQLEAALAPAEGEAPAPSAEQGEPAEAGGAEGAGGDADAG